MPRGARTVAIIVLLLAACSSTGEVRDAAPVGEAGDAAPLPSGPLVFTLDASSARWSAAPFAHEVPLECPLPDTVPATPGFADAHAFRNDSASPAIEVVVEGANVDPELTGRPEVIVFAGTALPRTIAEGRDCLAIATAAAPDPGVMVVPAEPGASILVVAYQLSSDRFGTYRVTLSPSP